MIPLGERLKNGEQLISDGAMGTMLFHRGLQSGECPESVNLKNPGLLEEIARLYLRAGADIIHTNTFGGSPLKLSDYDLADQTETINRIAVQAVRKVVRDQAYAAISCGPCGKILQPYGDTAPEAVYESFRQQLQAGLAAGADCVTIETMTDLNEACLAIKAAKSISTTIPVMATMTFDPTPRGFYTIMGVNVQSAVKGLSDAGAEVIGANCGNGMEKMIDIAREFKKFTDLPLLIQSNAGQPVLTDGQLVYSETPEFFAEKACQLLEMGVSIVGGCCGTTPEHIRAIRALL